MRGDPCCPLRGGQKMPHWVEQNSTPDAGGKRWQWDNDGVRMGHEISNCDIGKLEIG